MILERVEIVGFRGINRLSLMLEQNNVLIGENAWGKSSLLDALTLLLSPESDLYHFERDDFWFPPGDINGREHHLHIILTFRESLPGRHRVRRYRPLEACWTPCTDGYHRIFYRLEGESAEDGSVMTLRSFLDKDGHPIDVEDINDQARHLVRLMPVLRLRDARFMRRIRNGTVPNVPNVEVTARQLDFLARELSSHPQNLSDGQIRQGLSAMVQLLEHYFSEQGAGQARYRLMRRRASNEQRSWRYLDIINRMIDRPGGRSYRVILLGLFATLLQAKGTLRLDKDTADAVVKDNMTAGSAINWLRYMEISRSSTKINLDNLGLLTMQANITGTSRVDGKSGTVNLNYHHEENIFTLWRSLRFGDNLQAWLEQNARLPGNDCPQGKECEEKQ